MAMRCAPPGATANVHRMNQYRVVVLSAVLVCGGCGSSGNNSGPTGGGGVGEGSSGGGTAKAIATIPLATGGIVARMSADANGVVMTTLGSSGEQLLAVSPSGAVSTLYTTPTSGDLVINWALDAQTIYYAGSSPTGNGVYTLPRAGGTPTSLITTDPTHSFTNIVLDADNLYVVEATRAAHNLDGGASADTNALQQIGKSSGAASTIYTAPAGQQISNLIIDGGTLYWSEKGNSIQPSAATIRSATAGSGPLNPATVLEIPSPAGLEDMAETDGWIIGARLNISTGSGTDGGTGFSILDANFTISGGVFAVPATGGATMEVDALSSYPIAANPGVLYLNHGTGLGRASVSANGVAAPTMVAGTHYATMMAADHSGTLYYFSLTSSNTLYKL
jgi:hypothetical protein